MSLLVVHTLFGFTWDELASIVAIVATILGGIAWLIHISGKKAGKFLNENVHKPVEHVHHSVDNVDKSVKGLSKSVGSLRTELHRHAVTSSETLIKMQDRDNDFESRISWLEKIVSHVLHINK